MVKHLNNTPGLECASPAGAFYAFASCAGLIGRTSPAGRVLNSDEDVALALLDDGDGATPTEVVLPQTRCEGVGSETSQVSCPEPHSSPGKQRKPCAKSFSKPLFYRNLRSASNSASCSINTLFPDPMRKFFGYSFALTLVVLLIVYGVWTGQRPAGHYLSDLRIQLVIDEGQPGERGNLLGIQPELFPADYQSLDRLHRKLAAYLQQARDQGLINSRTIVVLPEHIGTWLFALGEKEELYQATTIEEAMNWLSASNPLQFVTAMLRAKGDSRVDDAHLRMKARFMAKNYQTLFGGLAREFGVTLVAGSIVLPDPHVDEGRLRIGSGPLYNSTVVFGSDGLPMGQPQWQLFPALYQRTYIQPAVNAPLNVIDTPAGRLAVLIGNDSWYPSNYARLNDSGAELIAVPAFLAGSGRWYAPWRGAKADPSSPPIGLKPEVVNTTSVITEGNAWRQLALSGHAHSSARAGISVFMRGQFWDQGSSGHSFTSHDGQNSAELQFIASPPGVKPGHGARMINLWL
jgi:predicted amidohydrolase